MMQKPKKSGLDKQSDIKVTKKQEKKIKFNLEKSYLQCFISNKNQTKLKEKKIQMQASFDKNPKFKLSVKVKDEIQSTFKNRSISYLNIDSKIFNSKLLVMDYDQDQVYTDSTRSKNKPKSNTPSLKSDKSAQEAQEYDFVTPCVRVITQETDNTSNPVSARYTSQQQSPETFVYFSNIQRESVRNKRAVSAQESSLYCIFLENIIKDGRTTIMLRNIPNKYTRDMILEEIDMFNFKKKYDFFYLPIDYRNQCNVGYAFINFIHTKFIKEFYEYFHMKKWQKFNSQKICQLCYARIQGTAQLINHFKDSNVLQQKDKKLRPVIDINYSNIASMIERQKNQTIHYQ